MRANNHSRTWQIDDIGCLCETISCSPGEATQAILEIISTKEMFFVSNDGLEASEPQIPNHKMFQNPTVREST
jgi:hypothetical protein